MLEPKKKCCCHVTAVHLFLIMKCVSRLVVDFFYELILLQNVFWYVIPLIVIFFFSFIGFHPYFLLISSSPVLHLCFLAWQQYPFLRVFVIKNLKWEITWPLTSNTRLNLFWRLSGNNQDWAIILIACCSMPYIVQLSRKDGFMGVYRQGAWARGVLVSLFPVWRETPSWSHGFAKAKMRKHWLFGGQPGCQVWVCHWCSYFYLCCVSTSK